MLSSEQNGAVSDTTGVEERFTAGYKNKAYELHSCNSRKAKRWKEYFL